MPRRVNLRDTTQTTYFPMRGGLDLDTPPSQIRPGSLIAAVNFECVQAGGYRRMLGYEKFDGRPSPSSSHYWVQWFENADSFPSAGDLIVGATSADSLEALVDAVQTANLILPYTGGTEAPDTPARGDTITGLTSGATGEILSVTTTSGAWASGTAAGDLNLINVTGTFQAAEGLKHASAQCAVATNAGTAGATGTAAGYLVVMGTAGGIYYQDGEDLEVSSTKFGEAVGVAVADAANDTTDHATWAALAIETARGDIVAPTGSDGITGVAIYNGDTYCCRTSSGVGKLYKATASGWSAVDLGKAVDFDTGSSEILEGDVLTVGANTATVNRVSVASGSWTGGDAAGTLVITTGSPSTIATGAATTDNGGVATITVAEYAQALPAAGRYEFVVHNFYGSSGTKRLYGVNGVGKAFEWDGTVFAFISTGMGALDKPEHVEEHRNMLWLSFANGSLQGSTPGEPLYWGSDGGAVEFAIGDDITGLKSQTGGTLGIFTKNQSKILYGTLFDGANADADLRDLSEESGAMEWTIQNIGQAHFLNERGVVNMGGIQEFGDFASVTISQKIDRILDSKRSLAMGSLTIKEKNQYRLFFSDGTGLVITFSGNTPVGITTFSYQDLPTCMISGESSSGEEIAFFGSSDGHVYQLEAGNSCDDKAMNALITTSYANLGSPSNNKRFAKATIEVEAGSDAAISYQTQFNYASALVPTGIKFTEDIVSSGGYWDEANWNEFSWSGGSMPLLEGNISGDGFNISLTISTSGLYIEPYTIYGLILHYRMRRLLR